MEIIVTFSNNVYSKTQNPRPSTNQQAFSTTGSPQFENTATTASTANGPSAPVSLANLNTPHHALNEGASGSSTLAQSTSSFGTMAFSSTPSCPTVTVADNSKSQAFKGPSTSLNGRLSNGAVAGIVVAVALGLALLTLLATIYIMRRNEELQKRRKASMQEKLDDMNAGRKGPLMTAGSQGGSDSWISALPQSADDAIIQRSVEATLEQIGLHVENFYQNTPKSTAEVEELELESFDLSFLPVSLAIMLRSSTKANPILKHTLSNLVTTSVSATGSPAQSLLPAESVLLPSKLRWSKSSSSKKSGDSTIGAK